jgi:hypothetical protein
VPELRKTVRQERHMAWSVLMHRADAVRAIALQLALVWRIKHRTPGHRVVLTSTIRRSRK